MESTGTIRLLAPAFPIAQYDNLPMPTEVGRLMGEISKVFRPRKVVGTRSVENFKIKDPTSGKEVEVGLWERPEIDLLRNFERGFIDILALNPGDVVYQRSLNRNGKVEVAKRARILRLYKASEYPGWNTCVAEAGNPPEPAGKPTPPCLVPSRSEISAPATSIPFPGRATAVGEPPRSSGAMVDDELRQMAACYVLCLEHAGWAVGLAEKASPPASTAPLGHLDVALAMFGRALHEGVHKQVDIDAFLKKHDVELFERLALQHGPVLQQLLEEIGEKNLSKAELMLRGCGQLGPTENLKRLPADRAQQLLSWNFPATVRTA